MRGRETLGTKFSSIHLCGRTKQKEALIQFFIKFLPVLADQNAYHWTT